MSPDAQTLVVMDRDDRPQHSAFLHALSDVTAGRVVCEITPGRRTRQRLADTLLTGLGKDPNLTGAAKNAQEQWRRVDAWVAGERASDLIVARAHLLTRGQWEQLMALTHPHKARLWLLVQGTTTSRGQREAIQAHRLEQLDFKEFGAHFASAPMEPERAARPADEFPRVPRDEFPTFLATCESTLSPDHWSRVHTRFWAAHDLTLDWLKRGPKTALQLEQELASLLGDLLQNTGRLDEIVVCLRAAQVAFFHAGFLLGVDADNLAAGYANTPRAVLDLTVAHQLRRLGHPRLAALGAITLITTPSPRRLAALDLGDLAADGATVRFDEEPVAVPAFAQGIVRSHLYYRQDQGASPDDPLFVSEVARAWEQQNLTRTTPHGIQQRLATIARETGVAVASSEGWPRTDKRWLKRKGITIRELHAAA